MLEVESDRDDLADKAGALQEEIKQQKEQEKERTQKANKQHDKELEGMVAKNEQVVRELQK